jgi:hypothetical protein
MMPDYGMTEQEFIATLERHLNAIAKVFARRFGVPYRFKVQLVKDD